MSAVFLWQQSNVSRAMHAPAMLRPDNCSHAKLHDFPFMVQGLQERNDR